MGLIDEIEGMMENVDDDVSAGVAGKVVGRVGKEKVGWQPPRKETRIRSTNECLVIQSTFR